MRIHVEKELKELLEDVLFDSWTAIEQHVFAHFFTKVVLRVKALNCFIDDINDALHRLRQKSG